MVDSLIRSAWLLRRFAAADASLFNRPFPPDSNENQDWRIGSSIANAPSRFDLLQRRINATEHNFHRSLKALQPSKPRPNWLRSRKKFSANLCVPPLRSQR